jgi:putative hydrolase of the HAD superfamily
VPAALLEEHAALREAMVGEAVLVAGARELLEELRGRGLALGILTNGSPELARRKLDALGLAELVDTMVTAEEAGAPKPDPRAYAAVAGALAHEPGRLAMVGDHLAWDVAGPLEAGYARALWLDRGTAAAPAELPSGAAAVRTLAEVPAALGLAQAG